MAEQKGIASAVITILGGGVLLFALTAGYNDFYHQPDVHISLNATGQTGHTADVTIINSGKASATHLQLTLQAPVNITNSSIFSTENYTTPIATKNSSTVLKVYVPRISSGFGSLVRLNVSVLARPNIVYHNKDYVAYVTHDQGSISTKPTFVTTPPAEYYFSISVLIVSGIVALTIPSIVRWINLKKQRRMVHQYHKRIGYLYDDSKLDENDVESLDRLKRDIEYSYANGKLTEQHYVNLKNEISTLYEQVYKKRIDLLNGKLDSSRFNSTILDNIKNDITDAYANGKLTEQHYNLLKEKISDYINK